MVGKKKRITTGLIDFWALSRVRLQIMNQTIKATQRVAFFNYKR
jgi:hypothetical protein